MRVFFAKVVIVVLAVTDVTIVLALLEAIDFGSRRPEEMSKTLPDRFWRSTGVASAVR
jgi:hypothetical protein